MGNNTKLNEIQSLDGLFNMLKRNIFISLNVCLPATVVEYNSTNNTVTLQPAIQALLSDNTFKYLWLIYERVV